MSRWQLYRAKREHIAGTGAVAMIEFAPGRDMAQSWASNVPFRYHSDDYEGDRPRASYYETSMKHPGEDLSAGVTRITVSERVVNALLKDTEIDPEAFAARVKNSLKPESKELKNARLKLKTTVDSRIIQARNVVGVLPGKDTSEIIVIGGHYDHVGKHDGWIWNGADDNASGTVGVMTIAKAMMASGEKPEKTIVFAAWTGEEKGLLGSEYFADHPWNDAEMILNLNYDMISRDDMDDSLGVKCSMTYTEKYGILEELAVKHNKEYDLGLEIKYNPQERPRGGSDHAPFAAKDVPVFYFMAGFPPEYHSTNDHVEKVNWDKMVKIIKLGYLNTWELSNTDWE
ncbi:MAG: M20/M25/M40 family metallo-hydrolase [Bacteroidales bacterium]|nr:M20/M25/M40 family metallo-hydrolase [Bacteroidales bacterium]MDT8432589.1 M20/M25/M40 family metallo-hydrolase [Bacteroidales bacterium]